MTCDVHLISDDVDTCFVEGEVEVVMGLDGPFGTRAIDLALSATGDLASSDRLGRFLLRLPINVEVAACLSSADDPPSQDVAIALTVDDEPVATLRYAAGENDGVFEFAETFMAGDVERALIGPGLLRITGPVDPAGLANLSITLAGDR